MDTAASAPAESQGLIDAIPKEQKVRRIRYECAQCGAEDFNKLFPTEQAAPCFNCWRCGAGRGIGDLGEQIARRQGMFPTYEVDEDNKRIPEA